MDKKVPYVTTRPDSRFYWFRRGVPERYRQLVGTREILFSLGATKLGDWEFRAHLAAKHVQELFEGLELLLKGNRAHSQADMEYYRSVIKQRVEGLRDGFTLKPLCDDAIEIIVSNFRQTTFLEFELKLEEQIPVQVLFDTPELKEIKREQASALYKSLTEESETKLEKLDEAVAKQDLDYLNPFITSQLEQYGFSQLLTDEVVMSGYRTKLIEALREVNLVILEHLKKQFLSSSHGLLQTTFSSKSWFELFEIWRKQREPVKKTASETKSNIESWLKFTRNLLPVFTTRAHARSWVKYLREEEGLKPNSVKRKVALLKAVLNFALAQRMISMEENPFADLVIDGLSNPKHRLHRLPFEEHHLKALFSSDVFKQSEMGTSAWVFLLALTSGARLEEIGQLSVQDVIEREGRLWLRFSDSQENQTLKNLSSHRCVPVHLEMLRIGFGKYCKKRKAQGERQLFPDLKPDTHGTYTKRLSTALGKYIDVHVIDDKRYVFHSFRHSFQDFAINSGVEQEVINVLVGHSLKGMGGRYGSKDQTGRRVFSDKVLLEAMDKLSFGTLDLTHLYDFQRSKMLKGEEGGLLLAA